MCRCALLLYTLITVLHIEWGHKNMHCLYKCVSTVMRETLRYKCISKIKRAQAEHNIMRKLLSLSFSLCPFFISLQWHSSRSLQLSVPADPSASALLSCWLFVSKPLWSMRRSFMPIDFQLQWSKIKLDVFLRRLPRPFSDLPTQRLFWVINTWMKVWGEL